jgi:hypothetical protein
MLRLRLMFALALVALAAATPAPARAEGEAPPPSRPRIEVAVGVGASLDDGGDKNAKGFAVPSFFVMGGFGHGAVGLDLGVFANSADGRYNNVEVAPLDRLAATGIVVVRPLAELSPEDWRYAMRIARTVAVDLGLGVERASRIARAAETVNRVGSLLGFHVDVPLTPRTAPQELRLRLALRRFYGASRVTFPDGAEVTDTRGELFAALASVF